MEQRNGDITYGQFAQLYRSLMFSAQKMVRAEFSRAGKREGETIFVIGHSLLIALAWLAGGCVGCWGQGRRCVSSGVRRAELHSAGLLPPLPSRSICAFAYAGEIECKPNVRASSFADGCPVPRKVENSLFAGERGCFLLLRDVLWCLSSVSGTRHAARLLLATTLLAFLYSE